MQYVLAASIARPCSALGSLPRIALMRFSSSCPVAGSGSSWNLAVPLLDGTTCARNVPSWRFPLCPPAEALPPPFRWTGGEYSSSLSGSKPARNAAGCYFLDALNAADNSAMASRSPWWLSSMADRRLTLNTPFPPSGFLLPAARLVPRFCGLRLGPDLESPRGAPRPGSFLWWYPGCPESESRSCT